MTVEAPKPLVMPTIDYADHTVEIDTRGLFNAMAALQRENEARDELAALQDSNCDADLTVAQIHSLLSHGK